MPEIAAKRNIYVQTSWIPLCEGEGEVGFFNAKRWDRRSRADLIESATPCHDAHVVGPYRLSNPLHLTVLATKSEDYNMAPRNVHFVNDLPFAK